MRRGYSQRIELLQDKAIKSMRLLQVYNLAILVSMFYFCYKRKLWRAWKLRSLKYFD